MCLILDEWSVGYYGDMALMKIDRLFQLVYLNGQRLKNNVDFSNLIVFSKCFKFLNNIYSLHLMVKYNLFLRVIVSC